MGGDLCQVPYNEEMGSYSGCLFFFFCLWSANASEGYGYTCVLDLVKVILLLTQLLLKQPHE